MHTLLDLSTILCILAGSTINLRLLQRVQDWMQRRFVQFFMLIMPIAIVGIGLSDLHHFIGHHCLTHLALWDDLMGVILPLGMTAVAFGAVFLGLLRLAFIRQSIAKDMVSAPAFLIEMVDDLAQSCHARRPLLKVRQYNRPLAFTCGLHRPTIVVPTWMLEQLDHHELEAVLAHEPNISPVMIT
ncbi:MAG TPA: M48 family metalloprotease [Ktedonobacteraceae bacterium]|jgi:Zn-dependent protease with chaperone function|nr:M48 family metalloprotease [Ktedonobacteraceae bacterium]